jgi:hypothetical protein
MSGKEPWDDKWKTNGRARIRGCDGVIALVTTDNRPLTLPAGFAGVNAL